MDDRGGKQDYGKQTLTSGATVAITIDRYDCLKTDIIDLAIIIIRSSSLWCENFTSEVTKLSVFGPKMIYRCLELDISYLLFADDS